MNMKTTQLSILNDRSWLKIHALINGAAVGRRFDQANLRANEAEAAIAAGNKAWAACGSKTAKERDVIPMKEMFCDTRS